MSQPLPTAASDLRGLARLAVEAATGMTDLVEEVHDSIRHPLDPQPEGESPRSRGVKGAVYGAIRSLTRTLGSGVEAALAPFDPAPDGAAGSLEREALLAALNGVLGDHLAATRNPLALPMSLRCEGRRLDLESAEWATAIPNPGPRVLVLVHGLCRNDRQWNQAGHDHGAALSRDLGYAPVHLRYNSGLHVSTNGKDFADLLEVLLARWPVPVESLAILAHSMGGLVARSACHRAEVAKQAWLPALSHLIFLGTPHHGAPLERGGHLFERVLEASPFAGPLARLGKVRSAGITDLRHGNVLDEDWQGHDRFVQGKDTRTPVPLPPGVRCCALAATTAKRADSIKGRVLGDGLVTVDSALGRHRDPLRCLAFPADAVWVGEGMNHLDLLSRPEAYAQIKAWLQRPA